MQTTTQIDKKEVKTNDNIRFDVLDFPGNYVLKNDSQRHIADCGALIYVIDAQSQEYDTACDKLKELIQQTSAIKPNLNYEVFIHKVDSDMFMTDDQKGDCIIQIQNNMQSLLQDHKCDGQMTYHLTSIYDHTVYEALSKVV